MGGWGERGRSSGGRGFDKRGKNVLVQGKKERGNLLSSWEPIGPTPAALFSFLISTKKVRPFLDELLGGWGMECPSILFFWTDIFLFFCYLCGVRAGLEHTYCEAGLGWT